MRDPVTKWVVSLKAVSARCGFPFTVYLDLLNQGNLSHRREFGFFLTVRRSNVPERPSGIDLRPRIRSIPPKFRLAPLFFEVFRTADRLNRGRCRKTVV